MSIPIVLCVVAVEAVNLVLLWVALRVNMSRLLRPLVAGIGVSGAWGAWILVLALNHPVGMLALTVAVFALSAVAMGMAIHLATVEENRQGEGGSGAPSAVPATPGGGGHDEPAWWPEFQRQVAAYAARRERNHEPEREREPVES